MPVASDFAVEKLELQAVLDPGIFERAPGLAQVLTYVCNQYFANQAEQIKEYNIGVEALGRPADFDQKRDSIVRVQVHRLRERLAEYYKGDGAGHTTQIEIPQGQYAPRFVTSASPAKEAPFAPAQVVLKPGRNRMALAGLVSLLVVVGGGFLIWREGRPANAASGSVAASRFAVPALAPLDSVRVVTGLTDHDYTDGFGHTWLSDRYFEGGEIVAALNQRILGTRDQRLYQTPREGSFSYQIPLKPGVYELRLHFAETYYGETNPTGVGGELTRFFDILLNGKPVAERLDVIGEAGARTADVKVFRDVRPAGDGYLHISFRPRASSPFLNGIEVTPGVAGRMLPIRYVAQTHGYTDSRGQYWEPDRTAIGGVLVTHDVHVTHTPDPDLYAGGRFGNLTYAIPVAPGRYALTVFTSEKMFGPGKPRGGGEGSHLFDILCNGVALVRNLDVYQRAGGPDRAVAVTFHGLQPNYSGKLTISMIPVTGLYPYINGSKWSTKPVEATISIILDVYTENFLESLVTPNNSTKYETSISVLASEQHPRGAKPLLKRDRRVLKDLPVSTNRAFTEIS